MNAPPKKPAVDFELWDHRPQLLDYMITLALEHLNYVEAFISMAKANDAEALEVVMRGFHATTGPLYANYRDYKALNAKEGA